MDNRHIHIAAPHILLSTVISESVVHQPPGWVVMQVVSTFSLKKEEGHISWKHGEQVEVNEETENNKDKDTDYEIKTEDLDELEHINQYVLDNLDMEPPASYLLPPGWSTTGSSMLCPPPNLSFYFSSRLSAYQALTSSSASPKVGLRNNKIDF